MGCKCSFMLTLTLWWDVVLFYISLCRNGTSNIVTFPPSLVLFLNKCHFWKKKRILILLYTTSDLCSLFLLRFCWRPHPLIITQIIIYKILKHKGLRQVLSSVSMWGMRESRCNTPALQKHLRDLPQISWIIHICVNLIYNMQRLACQFHLKFWLLYLDDLLINFVAVCIQYIFHHFEFWPTFSNSTWTVCPIFTKIGSDHL